MDIRQHRRRLVRELKEAGITNYGLLKLETKRLPKIIHEDEQIGGIIYGPTTSNKIGSAMLIATDKRIVFLDAKPFFTTSDEIAYRVVSGVKINYAGPFASVTLHTRIGDYGMRFVNKTCARIFETFIETYIELHKNGEKQVFNNIDKMTSKEMVDENKFGTPSPRLQEFLDLVENQNTAVLSTVDKDGNAHGSVVHYIFRDGVFFIVTKSQTLKAQNISVHKQVSLTVQNPNGLKTAQVSAMAERETNTKVVNDIYSIISAARQYAEGNHFPPIVSMKKGDTVVFRITPIGLQFQDFSKKNW